MLQTLSIFPHKRRVDSEWVCPAATHTARECVTVKFHTSCIVRVFSSSSRKEAVSCESLYCVSRVEDHKFRNASRIRSSSSAHFASALLSQICCPTLASPSCICTHVLHEQRVDHMKTSSNMLLSGLVYRMPTSKIMQRTDEGVARTFLTVSTSTRCTIRSSNFCNSVGAMWAGECSALSSLNTSPHETAAPGAHSSSMHSNPSPDPHVRSSIGERAVAAWQFSIDLLAAWHMSRVLSCCTCALLWGVCRVQSRPSREQTSQTEHTEDTHARSCASHGYTCTKFQQRVAATSTTGNVNALNAQETAGQQELRQCSSLGTISRSTARLRVPAAHAPFQP